MSSTRPLFCEIYILLRGLRVCGSVDQTPEFRYWDRNLEQVIFSLSLYFFIWKVEAIKALELKRFKYLTRR